MEQETRELLHESAAVAGKVLSRSFGCAVQVGEGTALQMGESFRVFRLALLDGPAEAPASVVLKRPTLRQGAHFDPLSDDWQVLAVHDEWAGLELLDSLAGTDEPVAPRFYGGDRETGSVVMEDLQGSLRLDHLLLGSDRMAAEEGLLEMARALGRLHSLTYGRQADYERIRVPLGLPTPGPSPERQCFLFQDTLQKVAGPAGIALAPGTAEDIASLGTVLRPDDPFWTYTHDDPCPDNWVGSGARLVLIDFEHGGFRNALLDGVYARMNFPTCWCTNRVPDAVVGRMEGTYRDELRSSIPAASDESLYSQALVGACAVHCLRTLRIFLHKGDELWGTATLLQRVVARLVALAAVGEQLGQLEALSATCRQLAAKLREAGPAEQVELPLYPAFR